MSTTAFFSVSMTEMVSELLQAHVAEGGLALVVAHRDLALRCPVRRLELNS